MLSERMGRLATGLAIGLLLAACSGEATSPERASDARAEAAPGQAETLIADGPHDVAVLEVRSFGTIRFELFPELAPETVANFVKLSEEGVFDGTTFHRVIPGFMIQGGDPNTRDMDPRNDGRGGPGYRIDDEFSDLPHVRGIVAMANSGAPNTGGSQFFIVHQDSPDLDGHYTAFGRVIAGIEVVDTITGLEIDEFGRYGPADRPHPVSAVLEKVRIEPAASLARLDPADPSR